LGWLPGVCKNTLGPASGPSLQTLALLWLVWHTRTLMGEAALASEPGHWHARLRARLGQLMCAHDWEITDETLDIVRGPHTANLRRHYVHELLRCRRCGAVKSGVCLYQKLQ
jgi:hypothetical protein